jgi:hypothetical protein
VVVSDVADEVVDVEFEVRTRLRNLSQPRRQIRARTASSNLSPFNDNPSDALLITHFGAGSHASITLFAAVIQLPLLQLRILRLPRAASPQTSSPFITSCFLQLPVKYDLDIFRTAELQIFSAITGADIAACKYQGVTSKIQLRKMGCRELGSKTLGRRKRRRNGCGAVGLG